MSEAAILVIGGAGYIGSHMVMDLLRASYPVVILDNLSRGHRELLPGGDFVNGDMGNPQDLRAVFAKYPVKAVMHFAAHSLVGESVEQPLAYYRNNVANTITLLEEMERANIGHFIFSSTAAVYGEPVSTPIAEDHPCAPTNPYGATKLAVERLLADVSHANGMTFSILRYFNAAGADHSGKIGERHQPETHLIPLVLQVATGERESIKIFGDDYPTPDGTCLRDYVHVSDLTRAHLLALEHLLAGGANTTCNLGNSNGYSVRQIIDTAREITGHAIPAETVARRAGDPAILIADSSKIRRELGWQPAYEDVGDIIRSAWVWHQQEASG
ncbi:MAG: UDP-glucose 4-epimerase GalE [Gammaproteobacteria bacterium]|nr:UDP-glucose 4-epimerase GalE [Gammaproteobacteria bacterium]